MANAVAVVRGWDMAERVEFGAVEGEGEETLLSLGGSISVRGTRRYATFVEV